MQTKPGNKPAQSSTGRPASRGARIRSLIRKNLVASPDFPRLYAEVLESEGYNFNQAKDLAIQLQKKLGVHKPQRGVPTCSHIMVTGIRCQSPALRGEQFCYFHQRMLAGVALPRTRLHHVALLENEEAIQVSLMEVVNGLMSGAIDLRRGELILRALNTAVRNSRRVKFNIDTEKMVREVPHYEQEAEARDRAREEVRAEISRVRAEAAQQLAAPPPDPKKAEAQRAESKSTTPSAADPAERKPPAAVKTAPAANQRQTATRIGNG